MGGTKRYINVKIDQGPQAAVRQTGPDLPRERVSTDPITGEVLEWRSGAGGFGWIKPDEPVEHKDASWHSSKIYVHSKDLPSGVESLKAGDKVTFQLYQMRTVWVRKRSPCRVHERLVGLPGSVH